MINSKSPNDFRWSVRLTGGNRIYIGIASQLQRKSAFVGNYDQYAIIYSPAYGTIHKDRNQIQIETIKAESGGEIHFRFQPKLKKFSFSIVCNNIFNLF